MLFYATIVILLAVVVSTHLVAIPIGCEVAEMMISVVKVNVLKAKVDNAKRKCFQRKVIIMRVNAVKPLQIWHGPYWCLG